MAQLLDSREITLSRVPAIADYISTNKCNVVKLHLGCGGERWRDFINVDLYDVSDTQPDTSRSGCVADAAGDMRHLGLPDNSIDEIFTSHTLEHFTRWEAIDMLSDWHKMLKAGAKLVIETPDFLRCILWLVHPIKARRQLARNMFYGNQWDRIPFETHRYVWGRTELCNELTKIGFIVQRATSRTLTHHPGRDQRVECVKPAV